MSNLTKKIVFESFALNESRCVSMFIQTTLDKIKYALNKRIIKKNILNIDT